MPTQWGYYKRPDGDMAQLPADDEARANYEGKGFEFVSDAPMPGHEEVVPDEVTAANEVRRLQARANAANREFERLKGETEKVRSRATRRAAAAKAE